MDEYVDYYRLLVSGVRSELERAGYGVLCVTGGMLEQHSGSASTASNAILSALANTPVKGILSMSGSLVNDTRSDEFAKFLSQYSVPVVSVERVAQGVNSVVFNDAPAMRMLMQHLINDTSSQRFAFVRGLPADEASMLRERIFKEELINHDYDVDDSRIVNGNYDVFESYEAVYRLLAEQDDVDAIVAADDIMALSAARAAQALGKSAADDIVVAGFNDSPHSTQHSPALTTVRQPLDAMAKQAVKVLLQQIGRDSVASTVPKNPKVASVDSELVIRGSSIKTYFDDAVEGVERVEQYHDVMVRSVMGLKSPDNVDLYALATAFANTLNAPSNKFKQCLEAQLLPSLNAETIHWWSNLRLHMEKLCSSVCVTDDQLKAKPFIVNTLWKAQGRIWSLLMNQEFEINRAHDIGQRFLRDMGACAHLRDILKVLKAGLIEHGIKRCYLVRYVTPSPDPDSKAQLVFEFVNGVVADNQDAQFEAHEVLPERLFDELEHGMLLQCAVSAGNDIYGHILIDADCISNVNVAALVQSIGSAMRNQHILSTLASRTRELQNANEQLRNTLFTDVLTGLNSRISLQEHLQSLVEEAVATNGQVSVFHFDMDGFKAVNDSLGHDAGDVVLCQLAARLSSFVYQELGISGFVARLASDEFMVVTNLPMQDAALLGFAERILQMQSAPFEVRSHEITINASIGCVSYPNHVDQPDSLLKCADAAVAEAKQLGKNRVVIYDPELTAAFEHRLQLEQQMQKAITNGEMRLHFQPRIDLRTGEICAVEALMRWMRDGPDGPYHFAYPDEFIALAEKSGFITELDTFGLTAACRQAREWELAGTPLSVSVNVSVVQLQQDRFVETVERALKSHQLRPDLLELEITESAAMSDVEQNIDKLNQIKDMGVQMSIDDFGTGYSSLNYLKRLPVNNLKIDRSFIMGVERIGDTPSVDETIIKSVIALGKSMDFGVVAEGIETEEQHQLLKSLDCDQAQGYLFSKPAEPAEITRMLSETSTTKAA